MLLTISTTHQPATDLGFLLRKHPGKFQTFPLSFGNAHVFYSSATSERCCFSMQLEVDPIALVRGKGKDSGETFGLRQYVNDRPYAASSFLSVAIAQVLGSALSGKSPDYTELVETKIPLEATIAVLPCRGGEGFLRNLFEPLGYQVDATRHTLDDNFPEWGDSSYFTVTLANVVTLQELLTHLYVLIPVLDNEKHYWVGNDEIEKLVRKGAGWLESHPEKETIALRYLKHRRSLAREALARLLPESEEAESDPIRGPADLETALEEKLSLHEQRLALVCELMKGSGAKKVLDLGCGEGKLLRLMLREKQFEEIVGMDVSIRSLEIASEKLKLEELREKNRRRISIFQGSLMYCDKRLAGFDAAAVVEVIEHLDQPRLHAFERSIFEFAKPSVVIITTPNVEYNVLFENLPPGKFRHSDHRFEWTRAQFQDWANSLSEKFGYSVEFQNIGPEHPELGSPTQLGVFRR